MQTRSHSACVSRRRLLQAAATPVWLLPTSAQNPGQLRFQEAGRGEFEFNTGVLAGKLRAGGKSTGLRPVIHLASGTDLTRSMGLAGHYRVFTTNHRYGEGAWDWPSEASLKADGTVEVHWPPAEDRQFDMWAVYRWAGPATLDVETRVCSAADLPGFESFLAFYFSERFTSSMALVKNGSGKPVFLAATETDGVWQAFPRDARAVSLIQDGRWKIAPNPVDWNLRPALAQPIGLRRDPQSGITAVVMAPPGDCFAISMPHQAESHRSLYFSLFGRTVKAGETARARARMIITQAVREGEIAGGLYPSYLDQLR